MHLAADSEVEKQRWMGILKVCAGCISCSCCLCHMLAWHDGQQPVSGSNSTQLTVAYVYMCVCVCVWPTEYNARPWQE